MANHDRKKSRGSLSIFPFDIIRSLSRAGSRKACLSSDDDDQPETISPYENTQAAEMVHPPSCPMSLAPAVVQPRQRAKSDVEKETAAEVTKRYLKKPRKHRPSSWFPPSTIFSRALDPRKDSTSSTTERSTISAPILRSTTNTNVALTERVHCGHTQTSRLAASPLDPKLSCMSDVLGTKLAENQCDDVRDQQSPIDICSQPEQYSDGLGQRLREPSKRSASVDALSNMKDVVTARLREAGDPEAYHSVFRKDRFERLGDGCRPPSPLNERLARVRTEGRNLEKDKIRMLTGEGKVRRKRAPHPSQTHQESLRAQASSFLVDVQDSCDVEHHPIGKKERALEFNFEDLEISFTKAVADLDFQAQRDKPSLTSLSSGFHSTENISAQNDASASQSAMRLCPRPCAPSSASHSLHEQTPCPASDELDPTQQDMGQCASRVLKLGSKRAKAHAEVYALPNQVSPGSDQDTGGADRTARAQRIFSQGHSDPLASHPNLTKFADQPLSTLNMPQMPLRGETSQICGNNQEHGIQCLENAPIYSPSLDKLSQYDVNTPATAPPGADISSHKLCAPINRTRLPKTPTKSAIIGTDSSQGKLRHNRSPARQSSNAAFRALGKYDKTDSPRLRVTQSVNVADTSDDQPGRDLKREEQNVVSGAC